MYRRAKQELGSFCMSPLLAIYCLLVHVAMMLFIYNVFADNSAMFRLSFEVPLELVSHFLCYLSQFVSEIEPSFKDIFSFSTCSLSKWQHEFT